MDLDALVGKIETRRLGHAAHTLFSADQNGFAKTLIDERISGADYLLLLALREYHAFGSAPNTSR